MDPIKPQFIDIFAGAGGLSLGLIKAGWTGVFAIEKSPMAFETLKHNLIDKDDRWQFQWPEWLPKQPMDIQTLLAQYREQLNDLQGLPLLAGGPPCQGFSNSGKRRHDDARNLLFEQYLQLVDLLKPRIVLLENVRGFANSFTKTEKGVSGEEIYEEPFNADQSLYSSLIQMEYIPFREYKIMAKDFGVPQLRPRYIMIAFRKDLFALNSCIDPFALLKNIREQFLSQHGLNPSQEVTLSEAISDLERRHGVTVCIESGMQSFMQGLYGPSNSPFQTLMRQTRDGRAIEIGSVADSHRFTNHRPEIIARFERITRECTPGIQLNNTQREAMALHKHRIAPLAAQEPSHTLTSLPDDCIHYLEPRILTVREYARIQSFPDWFEFKAKYTTGDKNRRTEIPRYTQVANAVPPLFAELLGVTLLKVFIKSLIPHDIEVPLQLSRKETDMPCSERISVFETGQTQVKLEEAVGVEYVA